MSAPEDFHRLGRTQESILALLRDGKHGDALTIWNGLDDDDKQKVFVALAMMVNHLRKERGDPPDATYGPPEVTGL